MRVVQSYSENRAQGKIDVPPTSSRATRGVFNYDNRQQGFCKNVIPGGQSLNRGTDSSGCFHLGGDITSRLSLNIESAGDHSAGPYGQVFVRVAERATTFQDQSI